MSLSNCLADLDEQWTNTKPHFITLILNTVIRSFFDSIPLKYEGNSYCSLPFKIVHRPMYCGSSSAVGERLNSIGEVHPFMPETTCFKRGYLLSNGNAWHVLLLCTD